MGELAEESSVMEEIWKDIKGYEGKYQVSDQGRVRSLNCHRGSNVVILKPREKKSGYLEIGLCKNGKKFFYVHRLVALAFVPNDDPEHKTQCNHINEDKLDCRALNLNWLSPKENTNWGTGIERCSKERINGKRSKQVVQTTLDGTIIKIWPSISEASRNCFDRGAIWRCCNGKQKNHLGYTWEYADFGRMFWYCKKLVINLWPVGH